MRVPTTTRTSAGILFLRHLRITPLINPALWKRLYLEDCKGGMGLRPDGVVAVPEALQATCVSLLLEIESGRKETGFEELAHAATLRAYAARAATVVPAMLAAAGISAARPLRLLFVAATPVLEARLATGVQRALGALRPRDEQVVLLTSLDRLLPRIVPASRAERADALRARAELFFAAVWRTARTETRIPLFPG